MTRPSSTPGLTTRRPTTRSRPGLRRDRPGDGATSTSAAYDHLGAAGRARARRCWRSAVVVGSWEIDQFGCVRGEVDLSHDDTIERRDAAGHAVRVRARG